MQWHVKPFDELTAAELHAILALRSRVFVVEQRSAFQDPDEHDRHARHLWGAEGGEIVAYLRALPPGEKYAEASIGRIVVAASGRKTGLGKELVRRGIALCAGPIRISAQAYLERFYHDLGFDPVSGLYDEDGIPHLEMLRPSPLPLR